MINDMQVEVGYEAARAYCVYQLASPRLIDELLYNKNYSAAKPDLICRDSASDFCGLLGMISSKSLGSRLTGRGYDAF